MGTSESKCDVVVVGSGLSGLAAAKNLKEQGYNVQVVEANDRIGGRMYGRNVPEANGHWVDYGGQWVGPTQPLMLSLLKELDLEMYDSFAGNTVLHFGGKRILFDGDMSFGVMPEKSGKPNRSQKELDDIDQAWSKLKVIVEKLPKESKELADKSLAPLDGTTMMTWIDNNLITDFGKFFFTAMCRSLGPNGPMEPSMHSVLGFCLAQRHCPQVEIPEMYLIRGGAGQIPDLLVRKIGKENVHTSCRVDEIQQDDQGVRVFCQNGAKVFAAKFAIVAMPPAMSGRISYKPSLPSIRQQIVQRWPMGTAVKVFTTFPSPFWKEEKIGGCLGNLDYIETAADASDPANGAGIFVSFIVGDKYRRWSNLPSDDDRHVAIVEDVVKYLGPQAKSPSAVFWADWPAEPFIGGGYGGFPAPGSAFEHLPHCSKPFGRVFWAGTEISLKWHGYFEGALDTGYRAASQIHSQVQ